MSDEKFVDESWKDAVSSNKEIDASSEKLVCAESEQDSDFTGFDFLSYISSLAFQAMIFLGDLPHPVTNKPEKNIKQAKLLIDTLGLLKEKTIGNLTKEENDLLNGSLYQLQMRYV